MLSHAFVSYFTTYLQAPLLRVYQRAASTLSSLDWLAVIDAPQNQTMAAVPFLWPLGCYTYRKRLFTLDLLL